METCPFCGRDDFDLIGLKAHLTGGNCEVFEAVETVAEERARLQREKDQPK